MLKRIYIDNYKGFVRFEYEPAKLELLLGDNGSGKTTLFEVLALLRAMIIDGKTVVEAFPKSSTTRWQQKEEQTIEIDVEGNGGCYHYSLKVRNQDTQKPVILQESLSYSSGKLSHPKNDPKRAKNTNLFRTDEGVGFLFSPTPEDISELDRTSVVLVDLTRSGLYFFEQRDGLEHIKWFTAWMRNLFVVHIDPAAIINTTSDDDDVSHPAVNMADYASWYRHLVQENPNLIVEASTYMGEVMETFSGISLERAGEIRVLKVLSDNSDVKFNLSELSDGQRVLIVLYTLLSVMKDSPGLLCIDEPDNYVALREIQPWLQEIDMLTEDTEAQVLLISHHPEFINYLTPVAAKRFFREKMGPVMIERFKVSEANEGLLPAEVIARGWEDE